ncbi:MAG: acyltransferase family protein [Candidatus Omnitrophica bacterium]|nr:acyltransferase family protein [Candidatus Omnitrophota bacterium]
MKNSTLNVLKGLAIVLVVYGHVLQRIMVLNGEDFFSHPVFKAIYTFHMPLFVFISGYLMAWSLSRRSIGEVFKIRCKSLLIPYIVWGTLGVMTFYALDVLDGKGAGFNFFGQWIDQLIIDPEIWFLSTLFFCAALLLFSVKLQERFRIAAFVAVYFLLLVIPYNEYGALYYIKWFYVFYAAGYFVNQYGGALIQKLNNKAVLAACLVLFVFLAPTWTTNDYIYVNKMNFMATEYCFEIFRFVYRYLVSFLGIGLAVFAGVYLMKTPAARWFEMAGIYSLDIYLLQRYLVEGLFSRLWPRTGIVWDTHSPLFLLAFAPAIVLIAVALCIALSKGLIRKHPLVNMLFLGQRT